MIHETPDGGFIVGGTTYSESGGNKAGPWYGVTDFWVICLDSTGGIIWQNSYGGSSGESLYNLSPMPDGGYVLAGASTSSASGNKTGAHFGQEDFWVVRIDVHGNKIWDKSFGGTSIDSARAVQPGACGGVVVVGESLSRANGNKTVTNVLNSADFWMLTLDAYGERLGEQVFGGRETDFPYEMIATPDGGLALVGYSYSPPSGNKTSPHYGDSDGGGP